MDPITLETQAEERPERSSEAQQVDPAAAGKRAVEVEIGGKSYRIRSDIDEAWLQRVASAVDDAMQQIRKRTDTVDSLEVAVLTALNLSRELLQLRDRVAVLEGNGAASAIDDAVDLRELIELVESEVRACGEAHAAERGHA